MFTNAGRYPCGISCSIAACHASYCIRAQLHASLRSATYLWAFGREAGKLGAVYDLCGPVNEGGLRPDDVELLERDRHEVLVDTTGIVALPCDGDTLWSWRYLENGHTSFWMVYFVDAA